MSSWSAKVIEQSAWRYNKPCTDADYKAQGGLPTTGKDYDQVVRYNYTNEDMHVLVDVVGMIKGLGALMMESESVLMPLIRRHIHDEVQDFLQTDVARPLRKAYKRNRGGTKEVMLQMRDICGDWINREEQKNDYMQKKKLLLQVNR